MGDLGSISSLTTLLAAESWIIKNPPEHGSTRSVGRATAIKHTQQNKVQGRKEKNPAHACRLKQPIISHSALQTGKSDTFTLPFGENFRHKHCRSQCSHITHDSWRRTLSQKHTALPENFCQKNQHLFFLNRNNDILTALKR